MQNKKWIIQDNLTTISIKQESKSRTRQDANICSISKNSHLKDEAIKNARLIAAAPELLAVLLAARNYLCDKDPRADARHELIDLINSTIAKATGEL